MHLISEKALRDFWAEHPDSESPLRAWARAVEGADWESPGDVSRTYPYTSQVGKFTVFNIGGNKYRLIAAIHFNRGKVFVRAIVTHAEYDRGDWRGG